MKKIMAALLALTITFSLAACGAPAPTGSAAPEVDASAQPTEAEGEWRLVESSAPLPEGMVYATAQGSAGDRLWLGGSGKDGPVLGYLDVGGASGTLPLPEGYEFLHALCASDGGVAALVGSYPAMYIDTEGNTVYSETQTPSLTLLILDEAGAVVSETPLTGSYGGQDMIIRQMLPRGDDFVLLSTSCLVLVGADGAEKGRVSEDGLRFTAMCRCGDGVVAACIGSGVKSFLRPLEAEGFSLAEGVALEPCVILGLGVSADGGLLANDMLTAGVLSVDMESGESATVFNWLEDMGGTEQSSADFVEALPDGGWRFFSRYEDAVYGVDNKFYPGVRTELTLATDGMGNLLPLIAGFNRSNPDYKVTATTYSDILAADAGLDALRTEITAGNAPDLFAFGDGATLSETEGSGVFEDLLPWLDSDPDLSRDSFVPGLLEAMETDGKLFWLPGGFNILTFRAPASVVGERSRITMAELEEIAASKGAGECVFAEWMSRDILLAWAGRFAIPRLVDWEAGTCNFESPDFIALLERCAAQGPSYSEGGGPVRDDPGILDFEGLQSVARLWGIRSYRGDDYAFVGFPNEDTNGSVFSLPMRLAISSTSEHKEGCREFLRFCVQNSGGQDSAAFPVLKAELDSQLNAYLEGVPGYIAGETNKIERSDVEKFYTLLSETTMLEGTDQTLLDIIAEEAGYFFNGDRDAAACAARIQSRASQYVSEKV